MTKIIKILLALSTLLIFNISHLHRVHAQDHYAHTAADVNHLARDEVSQRLTPLGFGLMGDKIDEYTGSLVFNQTDVSIPGNSSLEVAIRRIAANSHMTNQKEGFFGDWLLDVPNISSLSATHGSSGYFACVGGMDDDDEAARITGTDFPYPDGLYLHNSAFWDGMKLNIPGQGAQTLIGSREANHIYDDYFDQALWEPFDLPPYSGAGYSSNALGRITKNHWVVTCINPRSGGSGPWNYEYDNHAFDGYVAISPDGTRYRMDKHVVAEASDYRVEVVNRYLERNIGRFYATEVTDVHGNWVRYDWSADGKLERIYSNDGREITIAYHPSSKLIASVTANGRTWLYDYRVLSNDHPIASTIDNSLYRVTQPDGKFWEYNLEFLLLEQPSSHFPNSSNGVPYSFLNNYVKHPYGVQADYEFLTVRHARIYDQGDYFWHRTRSVASKTLSGASIPTSTWSYDYEEYSSSTPFSGDDTKTTTVTRPDGSRQVLHFYRDLDTLYQASWPLHGKPAKEEVFFADDLLEETVYSYQIGDPMGFVRGLDNGNAPWAHKVYELSKTVSRDGDTYTTEYTYNTDQDSSDYSYHEPLSVKTYSNVSTTPRETVTTYDHRKDRWVLNLSDTVTVNDRLTSEYGYNDLGKKIWEDEYGFRTFDYTYHSSGNQAGLRASMTDANDNSTYWNNYKRGSARYIERPDTLSDNYVVDDNGWPTDVTDYAGYKTQYDYDLMGRLIEVIPSKTQKTWVNTDIDYSFGATGIVQTITHGNQQKIIAYDNLFRPIEEQKYDMSTGNSIYLETEYDTVGEKIFESFPSSNANPTSGIEYTYDALGRKTSVRENVTPFATTLHDYHSNHRYQVIDPSGASTHYYYSGYDSSGKEELLRIRQSLGVTTELTRNIWGELTQVEQGRTQENCNSNPKNPLSVVCLIDLGQTADIPGGGQLTSTNLYNSQTQSFYYNDRRQMCGHYTPEGGLTRYGYDPAGRMTSYQKGAADSATCAAPSGTDLVSLTYDELDRLKLTNYADTGTADISKTYDNNSNVKTVNRAGINWTYSYDELNQITGEQLDVDGRSYDLAYEYDTSTNRISTTLPSGRLVTYSHDGLGRETNVESDGTDYASNVMYHPNNMIANMTYGNNQQYSQFLNDRLKPELRVSQKGAVTAINLTYSYDERGYVTSIIDGTNSTNNETMGYDDLGRLTTATGSWGTGSFAYDALGNLRQKRLGSRLVRVSYDTNNRAIRSTDTAASTRTIGYDNRGNVTTLGNLSFTYDKAQQPISLSGSSSGVYEYDGNLKRVKAWVDGNIIYNVYNAEGSLVYVDQVTAGGAIEVCLTSCSHIDIPKATDYIKAAGMTIVRISNGHSTYLHPDHLDSPVAGTNALGNVNWRENFTPYGEKLVGDTANDDLGAFTGHIGDSATGLTYMQARYYDPVIGRFLSIDPMTILDSDDDINPGLFNRYAYVYNNPTNMVDPDGEVGVLGGLVGAVVGAVGAGGGYISYTVFNSNGAGATAGGFIAATIGGAVVGGASGASGAYLAPVITAVGAIVIPAVVGIRDRIGQEYREERRDEYQSVTRDDKDDDQDVPDPDDTKDEDDDSSSNDGAGGDG